MLRCRVNPRHAFSIKREFSPFYICVAYNVLRVEAIVTESVNKGFNTVKAVDDISIHANEGEIYGFLGLNGAGKTTLIRMLLGMVKPDSGTIKLLGETLSPGFKRWNDIGYLVETPYSYPELTVYENLKVYHKLRQLRDPHLIDNIIDELKLTRYSNKRTKYLSLGNQQRLGLAKAMMHKPKVLILDEPINGLDPEGIVEVRELLQGLAAKGSTIFLSSHILGEVSNVAHRIGIIHEGRLVKELRTAELTKQLHRKLLVKTTDNVAAVNHLREAGYDAAMNTENEIEVADQDAITHPENISTLLVHARLPAQQVYQFTENLEMYFLRMIRNK